MAHPFEPQADAPAALHRDWEWFWRVLAAAMVLAVIWVAWIAYQIRPQPLATRAAYEAAAQARVRHVQQGMIKPAVLPQQKQPPVNIEKLRLSETLASPSHDK